MYKKLSNFILFRKGFNTQRRFQGGCREVPAKRPELDQCIALITTYQWTHINRTTPMTSGNADINLRKGII